MRVFYTDRCTVELPPGHRFPMAKYRLVREELVRQRVLAESELFEPELATRSARVLTRPGAMRRRGAE